MQRNVRINFRSQNVPTSRIVCYEQMSQTVGKGVTREVHIQSDLAGFYPDPSQ